MDHFFHISSIMATNIKYWPLKNLWCLKDYFFDNFFIFTICDLNKKNLFG